MSGHSAIQQVGFGLAGDEDATEDSHAEVTSYELFTPGGQPVPGGVYDLRLGTTDHSYKCPTCANDKKQCPGHRGHVALRVAVSQPIGIAEIRRWLRVVCLQCGEVVADRDKYARAPPARRLAEAATAAVEGKRCPRCATPHPRIVKDEEDHFTFWAEPPTPGEKKGARGAEKRGLKLYPDTIRAIFERVSDAAVAELGRPAGNHPRKLVRRVVAVPPNTIRPGVRSFGGAGSSYHDITNLLQHLVKRNGQMPEQLPAAMGPLGPGGPPVDGDTDRAVQNLQQIYYDMIMGSSSTSVTQGNSGRRGLVVGSRGVRSILRMLPRKEGRLRANLLGGRTFFISRSTISGNMHFRVDEVGVPLAYARTLQVEETVQEYNRDWLMTFFLNGRRQYPGCTLLVRRATRETHDVAGLRDFRLEAGDVLYRDVVDGDLAFFNRQPTLERSSIGVHRVVVVQDPSVRTFQMNVVACELYNADFDGDQMNLWVARGPAARAEAAVMSSVANWYISTKSSGPTNGEVQDSTVGCYELTRAGVALDKYHAMALFASAGAEPPRFDARPAGLPYTGREVASLLLAPTPINYSRTPSSYSDVYAPYVRYDPSETLTVVEQGRLTSGVLDKQAVGAKRSGSIFHIVSREYGPQRALDLIYSFQQVALQFLMYRGFTVGVADLLPSREALERIRELVAGVALEAGVVTERLLRGEIVPPLGSTVHEHYERLQRNALKANESEVLRWVLGSIRPETNGFFRMIAVGSKGSNPNLIHVAGLIGQTLINDQRLLEQFAFRRRSAYWPRFATDPGAYGFVRNSYMWGMTLSEYQSQNENGRYDLINKAMSTSATGYFMRKGTMNNQSSVVDNLRRVTKDTRVVQFLYGEDGLDSRELEKVSFRTVALGDAALREAVWAEAPAGPGAAEAQAAVDAALEKIREDRDVFRAVFMRVEDTNFGQTFTADLLMPVNVRRVVESVLSAAAAPAPPPSAAGLRARVERVWDLCERLPYALLNETLERRRAAVPAHLGAAAALLCMLVRAELCPRVLARLTDEQLGFIVDAVRQRYALSLIEYGAAVGILAAQAISEPLTQYMLDSHHRSVAGGTNKSGLVRVSEIYGARPLAEEQSAAMQLPLRPEALGDPAGALAVAQEIANSIEHVTLRNFVARFDVLLEPYAAFAAGAPAAAAAAVFPAFRGDRAWVAEFERAHPLIRPPADLTNWCFRFVLDKAALVLKAVELELIVRRLRARHPGLYVVHTSEAVGEVAVRAWHRAGQFKAAGDEEARADDLLEEAFDTPIRGIRGIMRATAQRVARHRVAAGGELLDAASRTALAGPPREGQKTLVAEAGQLIKEERYMIVTVGTNLYGALLHRAVDTRRAISNSINDTLKLYGVEAARAKVVSETRTFMEDNTPNLRHIYMYADEMFRTGRYTSVERAGLGAREHGNVFLRMAYGAPIQVLTDAALSGASSRVYGVAAPQLLGAVPRIGTTYNQLVVDEAFVRENLPSVNSVLDSL